MKSSTISRTLAFITISLLAACGKSDKAGAPSASKTDAPLTLEQLAGGDTGAASAQFINRKGENIGRVVFIESPNGGVLMRADLSGLSKGWHGIHLHQVGDCSDKDAGFKASGGHINPTNREHGLLNKKGAERADIPNIYAGSDGRATAAYFRTGLSLNPSEETGTLGNTYALFDQDGFAVVVHKNRDDHRSQPIGNAGERIACAVLGR